MTVRLTLTPDWSGLVDAIGGGPLLVRDGKPIFRSNEVFTVDQLVPRQPRTAVGQMQDGRIILVTVDGRRPGYSVGMTNFELALTLARLGAWTASALDGGGSSTMAFEGALLNRPSDPSGERAVAESLNLLYYGVHAPELPEEVVSPNGDGVGERQTLAYKLVRPSTVNARLIAPDGTRAARRRRSEDDARDLPLPVGGECARGALALRGRRDGRPRPRLAGGAPVLRQPHARLAAGSVRAPPRDAARFVHAHAHGAGAGDRPDRDRSDGSHARAPATLQAGSRSVAWRAQVRAGRYQLRVTAQNELGVVSLTAPFTVRGR